MKKAQLQERGEHFVWLQDSRPERQLREPTKDPMFSLSDYIHFHNTAVK